MVVVGGGCRGQTLILLLMSWSWSLQELVKNEEKTISVVQWTCGLPVVTTAAALQDWCLVQGAAL